jgi:glycosyltransferase involved in cell wall biosynthesis
MDGSRVRVGIWLSNFHPGGTERQMVELIRGLDTSRFDVHALCFAAAGSWRPVAERSAASITEFPINGFFRSATRRQLKRYAAWCRDRGIHVVLTSDFYTNVFGLAGAAMARVPVRIGGRRELVTEKTAPRLLLQRAAYQTAHRVIANSSAAAERLRREGVPSTRIAVVPNGIDAARYSCVRTARPVRRAVVVANLRPEKGHDILIEAVARHRPVFEGLEVLLVGDGPCRADLERLARERAVLPIVQFLGERHDIPELLAGADLFILPSLTEAFPNGVLEAMAAGMPVIATAVGGTCELVENAVSGVLVRPGDAGALAHAVTMLRADTRRAHEIGRAARERVVARYSIDRMVSAFSDVFHAELARRTKPQLRRAPTLASSR